MARLARDDRGRIWQGSDRLAVVDRLSASPCGDAARPGEAGPCDPATSKLEPVAVPMLPGRRIETLVYDASTRQLLVGLGASGLLVLRMH